MNHFLKSVRTRLDSIVRRIQGAGRFSLSKQPELPAVGDNHPLVRGAAGSMWTAAVSTMLVHLLLIGLWQARSTTGGDASVPEPSPLDSVRVMLLPPPIDPSFVAVAPSAPSVPKAAEFGTLLLVPDALPLDTTGISFDPIEGAPTGESTSFAGFFVAQSAAPIAIERDPRPDEFISYEEPPSLIEMPAPAYPEMARSAEVEGRVLLRVLVGKDGKVRDVLVTEGHAMLNEAAIDAVRRSAWHPALQQHRAVSVWVEVPMRFSLH